MVHIVAKKVGTHVYLSLQKSYYIKKTRRRKTKHIAYLGKADRYTSDDIAEIVKQANTKPSKKVNKTKKAV